MTAVTQQLQQDYNNRDMDSREVRHLISEAVQAMDAYLEIYAPNMDNADFRNCEDFILAAGEARRALNRY